MKKVILALLVLSLAFSIYSILAYWGDLDQSQDVVKNLQALENKIPIETKEVPRDQAPLESKETQKTDLLITANPNKILLDEIKDYVGWLEIKDSKINYPVVKAKDNTYYLNHDYYGNENVAGAIFMDRRNLGNSFDKHTIIYGHRMNNGSMFTDLDKFLDPDYLSTNPSIVYKDLYRTYEYEVLAAFIVSADDYVLPYDIKEEVITDFLAKSVYELNYDYDSNHRFITLSTCNYDVDNGRIIVVGVSR